MGESVEVDRLSKALDESEREIRDQITCLKEKYQNPDSGIGIIEMENAVQLCTKKEMYDYLIRIASTPKRNILTEALLETLSIVAYKQPVTKLEVERIRGVNSDHAVNRLVEFIHSFGDKEDTATIFFLFGSVQCFLQGFGNIHTPVSLHFKILGSEIYSCLIHRSVGKDRPGILSRYSYREDNHEQKSQCFYSLHVV